jgi:uncharacterized protein DUF6176
MRGGGYRDDLRAWDNSTVIQLVMYRVAEGQVELLRWWMGELMRRSDEVIQTFEYEGTREEAAYLLETADGPILVYVMDVADPERAGLAYRYSALPIDQQHKQVMHQVLGEAVEPELLYDVRLPRPGAA